MKTRNLFQVMLSVGLCLVLALGMVGCSSQEASGQADAAAGAEDSENVQIANPIHEYDSLKAAEKAAGFTFDVPEEVELDGVTYEPYYFSTINDELVEVRYGAEENEVCYMRKAAGVAFDISGDYNVYDDAREVAVKVADGRETTATFKSKGDKVYLATWTLKGAKDNGIDSYAIGILNGVSEKEMTALVKAVK